MSLPTFSVAEINSYIKRKFDTDMMLQSVIVSGEISNFSNHYKTGHLYFSLKDETAAIKCVMFNRQAARLKFTDNVIRYICAQTESYTELEFSATVGGKEITAAYEARRTGMSDTYNIRISNGDEITYFDGTAESAYKSGNIGFELRATKNAKVVNGCKLDLSFNGEKKLTYKGSGNFTVKGDKKTFSFELVFNDTENVEIPPAQSGETGLYEATERIFK